MAEMNELLDGAKRGRETRLMFVQQTLRVWHMLLQTQRRKRGKGECPNEHYKGMFGLNYNPLKVST